MLAMECLSTANSMTKKIIPKKEFSFYMADEQHQSVVNLGGRDSSLMKDGDKSKIYYLDLINY